MFKSKLKIKSTVSNWQTRCKTTAKKEKLRFSTGAQMCSNPYEVHLCKKSFVRYTDFNVFSYNKTVI